MSEQRQFPDWQQLYEHTPAETMPWYYPVLEPDLERALERHRVARGKALDLGTGPGTQAMALAERGFDVTGADLSAAAIEKARQEAQRRGVSVRFVEDDILDSRLDAQFDIVFDRGCFHCLPPDRRGDYVLTVHQLVAPGGYLFLKCFSVKEPRESGPHRFAPEDIRRLFEPRFQVESVDETVYQGTLDPFPLALFCVLTRR